VRGFIDICQETRVAMKNGIFIRMSGNENAPDSHVLYTGLEVIQSVGTTFHAYTTGDITNV
jgi:hypothetical protein